MVAQSGLQHQGDTRRQQQLAAHGEGGARTTSTKLNMLAAKTKAPMDCPTMLIELVVGWANSMVDTCQPRSAGAPAGRVCSPNNAPQPGQTDGRLVNSGI